MTIRLPAICCTRTRGRAPSRSRAGDGSGVGAPGEVAKVRRATARCRFRTIAPQARVRRSQCNLRSCASGSFHSQSALPIIKRAWTP
jgi:hypothetical protein